MQNQPLKTFDFQGSQVRTITKDGEPWFVVADACRVLGLSNPSIVADRLDPDDLSQAEAIDSMGRPQQVTITNESGIYDLILRSDKPEARKFKRWITHEVLPTIRKTGRYDVVDRLTRKDLAMLLLEAELEAETVRAALAAAAPLVAYAEKVQGSPSLVTVDECAKVLGLPVTAFRTFVREKYRELWSVIQDTPELPEL